MRYKAYVTDYCRLQAKKHSQIDTILKIADKLDNDQSVANWDNFLPHPIIKKNLGKSYRLIADQYRPEDIDDDVIVVRFLDVVSRSSPEYAQFIQSAADYCRSKEPGQMELNSIDYSILEDQAPQKALVEPSETELYYLYPEVQTVGELSDMVYESQDWVELVAQPNQQRLLIKYYELIWEVKDGEDSTTTYKTCGTTSATIVYRRFDDQRLFLIAAFEASDDARYHEVTHKYDYFLRCSPQEVTNEQLLRFSHRSYPKLVLADRSLWTAIEESETGNLALSPEETEILSSVRSAGSNDVSYPLFINGRPGSGKSTILQYLFAEHLYSHLNRQKDATIDHPPIYLTYGARLLEAAKTNVKTIIGTNAELAVEESVDLNSLENSGILDRSFGEFHRFLHDMLSSSSKEKMLFENRIGFAKFRQLWIEQSKKDPDHSVRTLTPEVAWHVIRTYIKGMRDDLGNYLDKDAYDELPTKQKTVMSDTFELVFDKVWKGWYEPYCSENSFWDTQDLARQILNDETLDLSMYPVVFCDEAQDFTKIELEIIYRLSLFSRRLIQPDMLRNVPFAFAGDPFQTLNPTGFDWDAVRAGFHEKIVQGLDRFSTAKLNFNYRELTYNYRSTANVVRFCNLIQLIRGIIFGTKNLRPQRIYFDDQASPMPTYFDINDPECRTNLEEQAEIVVILPCQEGEEDSYVQNDAFLTLLSQKSDGLRNFVSPMSAKGLEFSRVVLYKFGDECVNLYPELLLPLLDDAQTHVDSETSLPLQYFINRLYVAASRAMKRLIIIDTHDGIEYFWRRKELNQFDVLLQRYSSNNNWETTDLSYVTEGFVKSWSEDRDDPLTLAVTFYEAGKSESDPYKLRLAANNYRMAQREGKAKECDALRLKLEGHYLDAGRIYRELGDRKQSIRCFWIAQSYDELRNEAAPDSPEHRAADYMLSNRTYADSMSLLTYLHELRDGPSWDEIILDPHWEVIVNHVVTVLASEVQSADKWKEPHAHLSNLRRSGFRFKLSSELAKIAYQAERYTDAIEIWDQIDRSRSETELYSKAMAEVTPYPDNLEWLYKIKDNDSILNFWRQYPEVQLQGLQAQSVFSALLEQKQVTELLSFLKKYPSEERLIEALGGFKKQRELEMTEQLAQALVTFRARNGNWIGAIDLTIPNKAEKLPKHIHEKLHATVIREAAISHTLPSDTIKTKKYVEEYLRIMLIEKPWRGVVDIKSAGAAIERAGKIIDALNFYELIWRSKKIDATNDEVRFARERWVSCKYLQVEYSSQIGRIRDIEKQLQEAQRRAKEWNIETSELPEFPIIDDYTDSSLTETKSIVAVNSTDEKKEDADSETDWKFSGVAEDVIGPIELEAGLYRVSYSFQSTGDHPKLSISFEDTQADGDIAELTATGPVMNRGTQHAGKQKVRLNGGRYLIGVEIDDAGDWEIELQNVS